MSIKLHQPEGLKRLRAEESSQRQLVGRSVLHLPAAGVPAVFLRISSRLVTRYLRRRQLHLGAWLCWRRWPRQLMLGSWNHAGLRAP